MPSSSLTKFLDLTTDDPKLRPILDRLKEVIRVLSNKQLIDGQLLEDLPLVGAVITPVPHKLGRPYNGWILVKCSTSAGVSERRVAGGDYSNYVYLRATIDATVSIWVF